MKTLAEHAREFLDAGSGLVRAAASATGDAISDVWPGHKWLPVEEAPEEIRNIPCKRAMQVLVPHPSNEAEAIVFAFSEAGKRESYLIIPAPPKN